MQNRAVLLAVLAGGILLFATWAAGEWFTAGLPVSDFPELPQAVASDLEKRGCRIVPDRARRNGRNVISGDFAGHGRVDWAALCRQGDVASVLVYFAERPEDPAVLNPSPSGLGDDPESARTIGVAARAPEGIEDAVGMGSVILYYSAGEWQRLAGAD